MRKLPVTPTSPHRRRFVQGWASSAAVGASVGLASATGWAQSAYPDKPIRLVVGYPPGGSVDFVGRTIGEVLSAKLKTPVVIENLGGAAGTIAALRVSQVAPDGYTLLLGSSNELAGTGVINPAQKYDPLKDFTLTGMIASGPVLLIAGPKAGVKTLDEFIKVTRASPGKFSYGTSGVGTSLHFAAELMKKQAGIFMVHVPYRGVAPLGSDLVSGDIEVAMMSPAGARGLLATGKLTVLGVTSAKRLPAFPQIPSLSEHPLLKGYELNGWFALVGPKGLPTSVNLRLQAALQETLADASVQKKLEDAGNFVATGKEDLSAIVSAEIKKLQVVAKFANIRE